MLEDVQEYEESGRRLKINGYCYNFRQESMKKNKYYKCDKRQGARRCCGSVTISPNGQIIKKVEHTCDPSKNKNNQHIILTVDGYSYYYNKQFKNKNTHFRCKKSRSERCRGCVTLSPNGTVVRKRSHTCSSICKIGDGNCTESQNKAL